MKKILLLSDTHGHLDARILKYVRQADEVWHAGDIGTLNVTDQIGALKKIRAVHGNIDNHQIRTQFPEDIFFECEGLSVFMTHIGGYPERYNPRVLKILNARKPHLFICGHSHILKVMRDKKRNLLHLNPGAAGVVGFHKVRTMLRFEINLKEIKNLDVIELGLRGKLT